ncbi:MAG: aromatic aminobenezylarsenical efflux permease ArsG family transporter [Candidatus Omnitrophica bacterium]|nr:aromatic aminobenezylarsenical efflux permease ArsG family transporter [Candidatus Omnitrophota bacterium]
MIGIILLLIYAFWFGILTSISPCPLATNIAAISFLSKRINHPKQVLQSSIAYALGRMFTYAALGVVIISSLASVPATANFLQKYINKILGPTLLFVGLVLLNVIKLNIQTFSISQDKQTALAESGAKGSFVLGVVFALSFCPIAAALFFGSLIPLALKSTYGIILPFFYGIGTGIPVVIFALGIAIGVKSFSKWFHRITTLELYTRKITGIIFLFVGIYFIWSHVIINFLKQNQVVEGVF